MSGAVWADAYLDGKLMASTRADFDAGDTTVLEGLTIDWGRASSIDQPTPSSLAFKVVQRQGRASFLQALATGHLVEITASAMQFAGSAPTMQDPGFEAAALGSVPPVLVFNAVVQVSARQVNSGAHAAMIIAQSGAEQVITVFAPAPFSNDVTSWDDIPQTSPGQLWTVRAAVWALPGIRLVVKPALFQSPDGSAYSTLEPGVSVIGTGAWQHLTLEAFPDTPARWMGVEVSSPQIGPWWVQVPTTWGNTLRAWVDQGAAYVDDIDIEAPTEGTERTVLVFAGRITDLEAQWLRGLADGSLQVSATAKDFTADLANNRIGDVPWPVQPLGDRVARILTLAATGVTATVDASLAGTLVTYRDVDSQPAAGLIQELAQSVAGVAWSAVHEVSGPYYWIEDPRNRSALLVLVQNPSTGIVSVQRSATAPDAIELTASNVLEDPIRWGQDVSDVATRADVTWNEQGVDDQGLPTTTERHVLVVDTDLEAALGQRGMSVSTQLQADADAELVAATMLGRAGGTEWRLSGVEWALKYETEMTGDLITAALDLLDGTKRIGRPISVTNLPDWSPTGDLVGVYIEGGSYKFEDGDWDLTLTVSSAGQQGASIKWDEADPAWRWEQMDPGISWSDLMGVGPDPGGYIEHT